MNLTAITITSKKTNKQMKKKKVYFQKNLKSPSEYQVDANMDCVSLKYHHLKSCIEDA